MRTVIVRFSQVATAQYFVWYFCLLPLVWPDFPWPAPRSVIVSGLFWLVTQLNWLFWAYLLEFKVSVAMMLWRNMQHSKECRVAGLQILHLPSCARGFSALFGALVAEASQFGGPSLEHSLFVLSMLNILCLNRWLLFDTLNVSA